MILKVVLSQKKNLAHLVVFRLDHSRKPYKSRREGHLILEFFQRPYFLMLLDIPFCLEVLRKGVVLLGSIVFVLLGGGESIYVGIYFRGIKILIKNFTVN